jgi:hypothetical protein
VLNVSKHNGSGLGSMRADGHRERAADDLAFGSVVDLRRDLEQLRETAGSEKRWQSLLAR